MTSLISLIVAASGFAADGATKRYAEKHLKDRSKQLFGGSVTLRATGNSGFAYSKFEKRPKLVIAVSTAVFIIAAAVYALILIDSEYRPLRIAFGLAMAGAAGNIFDRWRKHYVVDFINIKPLKKIVFNLADVFIVTGSLLSILIYLCSE